MFKFRLFGASPSKFKTELGHFFDYFQMNASSAVGLWKYNRIFMNNSRLKFGTTYKLGPLEFPCSSFHSLTAVELKKSCRSIVDSTIICVFNENLKTMLESTINFCSTMRKRKAKMNKHKLKKRRKKLRMNTKVSRGK